MKGRSFFRAFIVLLALGGIMAYAYFLATENSYGDAVDRYADAANKEYESLVGRLNADGAEYEYTVLINPVLGGLERGDSADGVNESDVVLAVAQYVEELNIDDSLRIVLTRESNTNPSDRQRQSVATYVNPDVIIELRTELDADTNMLGASVYYDDSFYNYKLTNADLADLCLKNLVARTGTKAKGLYTGEETIFAKNIPCVTISLGYLSNAKERQALASDTYRQSIALGILDAIAEIDGRD